MPVIERYNIDITPKRVPQVIYASQYDAQSRDYYFTIYQDGELYEIPAGATVTVRGTKKDKTGFEYNCAYNGAEVKMIIEQQMTIYAGDVPCELRITNGAQILGSSNFILRVEPTTLADDTIISETELPLLEQAARAGALANQVGNNTDNINVLKARVDNIASLTEGSTTGDAELLDIRIGFDGTTHATAGDAVRAQAEELNAAIERLNDLSFGVDPTTAPINWFEKGNLGDQGEEAVFREKSRARSSKMFRFNGLCGVKMTTGQMMIFYYDDDGNFTSKSSWIDDHRLTVIDRNKNFKLLITLERSASAARFDSLESIVNDLEFTVDDNAKPISFNNLYFEHGSLTDGADSTYRQNARIRNKNIAQLPFTIEISMTTGLYYIHYFNDDDTFSYSEGWFTTEKKTIPAYQKFRIVMTLDLAGNAYQPVKEVLENLNIKIIDNIYSFSLNPNIIYQCRTLTGTPPESIWAVKGAAKNQYDRVRFTVRKTTDGYYFNCHDTNINRYVLNADGTELTEPVAANNKTLEELNGYDWGLKYGEKYRGAKAPMLEECLKYAAIYNMGVTYHSATAGIDTPEDATKILKMFDKFGLTDNMIVIVSNAQYKPVMLQFKEHNPRISFFIGGTMEYMTQNLETIKALQTEYNKIYVQLFPWGTQPTEEFIEYAKTNNFALYDSTAMSTDQILNENKYNKGFTLMEIDKTTMIKDTIRAWVDRLID